MLIAHFSLKLYLSKLKLKETNYNLKTRSNHGLFKVDLGQVRG